MLRKQMKFIVLTTIITIAILSLTICSSISFVNSRVEQKCFSDLTETSKALAKELKKGADTDQTILSSMAYEISNKNPKSNKELLQIINSYSLDSMFVSNIELLKPNNTILKSDGTKELVKDVNFADEAKKGKHIERIFVQSNSKDDAVIHNAVPVVKNGKTIYILYGAININDFAKKFRTDIYGGNAYVFIEESDTGDFLLDTWHDHYGNISSFSDREMLSGYSFDTLSENLKNGVSGTIGFVSKTINKPVFFAYEPSGIENWNVIVMVDKKTAFEENHLISNRLFGMGGCIGITMLIYVICISLSLYRAYRQVIKLSNEDQTTGLQNRNAYEKYLEKNQNKTFELVSCVFIDVNGLHEINNKFGHKVGDDMLCIVSDALKAEFGKDELYRVGGDEFVIFSEKGDLEFCNEKMQRVVEQIEACDYNIAYGIVSRKNELSVDRITQEADEKMLENKKSFYQNQEREKR